MSDAVQVARLLGKDGGQLRVLVATLWAALRTHPNRASREVGLSALADLGRQIEVLQAAARHVHANEHHGKLEDCVEESCVAASYRLDGLA